MTFFVNRGLARLGAMAAVAVLTAAVCAPAHAQQPSLIPIIIGTTIGNMGSGGCTRDEPPPQAFKDEVTPVLDASLVAYLEASLRGDLRTARGLTRGPGNWWGLDGQAHRISALLSLEGVVAPGVVPEVVRDTLTFSNERVAMRGRWRVITTDQTAEPVYLRVDFVQGFWSGWKVRNLRITRSDDLSMMPGDHCSSASLPPL